MKRIAIYIMEIIIISSCTNTFAQRPLLADTCSEGFSEFIAEMNYYKNNADSLETTPSCSEFILLWRVNLDMGKQYVFKMDSVASLCNDLNQYAELNKTTLSHSDVYGNWYYRFDSIGDKYFIITGDGAIDRFTREVFYYVRKE